MKYISIFLLSFFFVVPEIIRAQDHFIYLQTDNSQSFYIKLDNKIFSSSSAGYLIIGKLTDDNYKFVIGFPKSQWSEQIINITTKKKDQGFLLKNFGEKGWGLFNIETNEILMAGNIAVKDDIPQIKANDPFSTMLANVVNDSTILQKDNVKDIAENKPVERIKSDTPNVIVTNVVSDSMLSQKDNMGNNLENKLQKIKSDTDANFTNILQDGVTGGTLAYSNIKRTLRKKNKEGTELIYLDEFNNGIDTIRIFIPVEKVIKKDTIENKDIANTDSSNIKIKEEKLPNKKLNEQKVVTEIKDENKPQTKEYKFIEDKKDNNTITKSTMVNSDCKAFASDDDFLKLRKKMAAETTDENMIKIAKKAFKTKCYSTELIKNLSALFLKDEGKYMFFDAAYPFVSDSDLFPSLQSQLLDNYYINRFNAMVRK